MSRKKLKWINACLSFLCSVGGQCPPYELIFKYQITISKFQISSKFQPACAMHADRWPKLLEFQLLEFICILGFVIWNFYPLTSHISYVVCRLLLEKKKK